jgi:hypothetical protein
MLERSPVQARKKQVRFSLARRAHGADLGPRIVVSERWARRSTSRPLRRWARGPSKRRSRQCQAPDRPAGE